MQKVNDPAVRHTGSGALIRRFLPYLAKYKKILFIDLFCAAMTTLCDIIPVSYTPLRRAASEQPPALGR